MSLMVTSIADRRKGIISLILLAFVFASMGLFARYLNANFTILQQIYSRVFVAFILGYLLFYKDIDLGKLKLVSKKDWIVLVIRSISLYLLGVTLFTKALVLTKYSNVSFIGALPMVALLGFILLKEKITLQKVLYVSLAFAGVVLIAAKDYEHIFQWGEGEIYALVATFFFALSYISRRWQSNILNNKEIAVVIFFIASIILFITSLVFKEPLPALSKFTVPAIIAVSGAALFNVANLFLTNYGFQKVEAVLASNILTLETVFAVMLGFFFYQEIPNIKELIGGLLIIIGVYRMNKLTD